MSSNNKRTYTKRKSSAAQGSQGQPKATADPAWTSEQKEFIKDMFYTLRTEGRIKGGTKTAVRENLDTLVAELANHYDVFQEYLETVGGPWKRRKYDVLYRMVETWTEAIAVTDNAAEENPPL